MGWENIPAIVVVALVVVLYVALLVTLAYITSGEEEHRGWSSSTDNYAEGKQRRGRGVRP
jgi:hypothetical protein